MRFNLRPYSTAINIPKNKFSTGNAIAIINAPNKYTFASRLKNHMIFSFIFNPINTVFR